MSLKTASYISAAAAGVASHIAYFNKGEHHLYVALYFKLSITAIAAGAFALRYTQSQPWPHAFSTVSHLAATYLAGLYTSLLIYRLFLHPLRHFPGPIGARISSLNHDLYLKLHAYHAHYGLFVRTGSSDLSIAHPAAVQAIYSPASPCTKAAWYDLTHPGLALQNMRDPAVHAARRRVWARAFSDPLLRGYEARVRVFRQALVERLTNMRGRGVDARLWLNLYSFDVMGALTFGQGFGCLERGEPHWAIRLLDATMARIGLCVPAWVMLGLTAVPGLSGDWFRFLEFCGQMLVYRVKNKPDIPDVSSALIAHLQGRDPTPTEQLLLDGDARLVVVAGSDTTACTLAAVLYELVRHPEQADKLRAELAPYMDAAENGEFLHSAIANLDHLNGVINEALRLYPPVPGVLQRKTPPEGIMVDDVFIPGDMTVSCPQYVVGRSSLCYERPDEFIPERWYKHPEMINDKTVFAPFTIGPYSCIGKPLAMLNLRTTVARLVMEFDMRFAPGEDGRRFLEEAQDNFVLYMGELNLVFEPRA